MIGLADCNNFFVSCERTLDPSLCGRAVVVLSNNDGCAVARSNEAKRLGVKMGQPAFELRNLIDSGQLIALSGNHLLYRSISLRIHDIFRRYVPVTQDYSVDEAFLDMSGIPDYAIEEIGRSIHLACLEEEKIPVTIGFSHSRTLAKIATESGKKKGCPVNILSSENEIREILSTFPIHEIWGIGRRTAKKLAGFGVFTAGEFARRPLQWIRAKFGVNGERTWRELHGESCIELSHLERRRQDSISETRTFPEDTDDFDCIRSRIAIYCSHVAQKLRHSQSKCGMLTVFLCTNRFHLENGYHSPHESVKFDPPVCDTPTLVESATFALTQIFNPATPYKRAGVILSDISDAMATTSLFEPEESRIARQHAEKLMNTLDRINSHVGDQVVKLASQITKAHIGHNDGYSSSFGPAQPDW